jgi:hypothetical protein
LKDHIELIAKEKPGEDVPKPELARAKAQIEALQSDYDHALTRVKKELEH